MAGIDKTYTNSFEEYTNLKEWAKGTKFKCPNGMILDPHNYIYDYWSEEDFKKGERPVMITSYTLDYFLIKYCPFEFVQYRMQQVYSEDYYNSVKNGTSEYDTFTKEGKYGKHCKIIRKPDIITKHPWGRKAWWVQIENSKEYPYIWYNKDNDIWLWPNELGEAYSSVCINFKSLRSVIRHILKWKLPINSEVKITSRYVGIDWIIKITK